MNNKKHYYCIDFKNCNTDFDYTICESQDISEYLDLVTQQAEELDEEGFAIWKENGWLPTATVSVVMMTDQEFEEWFRDNLEANA